MKGIFSFLFIWLCFMVSSCGGSSGENDSLTNDGLTLNINAPQVMGLGKEMSVFVELSSSSQASLGFSNQRYTISIIDQNADNPIVCTPEALQVSVNMSPQAFACVNNAQDFMADETHVMSIVVIDGSGAVISTESQTIILSKFEPIVPSTGNNNLPSNVTLGKKYPVIFNFVNTNPNYSMTDVTTKAHVPDGFIEEENTCVGEIKPLSGCQIIGSLIAEEIGSIHLGYELLYNEGQPIASNLVTYVTSVSVIGRILQDLPSNLEKDTAYQYSILFSNSSQAADAKANAIVVNSQLPLGFVETSNTCSLINVLNPGQSCQINGWFKANIDKGSISVKYTLSYDEGSDVDLVTNANITDVVIVGALLQGLPINIEKDITDPLPVGVSFVNTNDVLAATGVVLIKSLPDGYTELSNTCNINELSPLQSCQIIGEYLPKAQGLNTVSYAMAYNQGQAVQVSTASQVADINIIGKVLISLPENIAVGVEYPVSFEFENQSDQFEATEVNVILNLPSGFQLQQNTCNANELAALAKCHVSGKLVANSDGSISASVNLSYKEGVDILLSTTATATTIIVTGSVSNGLPDEILLTQSYPLTFEFTNTNDLLPASSMNLLPISMANGAFVEQQNSCISDTLMPQASCGISGIFTPKEQGNFSIVYRLSYAEGANVEVSETVDVKLRTIIVSHFNQANFSQCYIQQSSNDFYGCNIISGVVTNGFRFIFDQANVYLLELGNTNIRSCQYAGLGDIEGCVTLNTIGVTFDQPSDVLIINDKVYISDVNANKIFSCTIDPSGQFTSCVENNSVKNYFSEPLSLTYDKNNQRLYVANSNTSAFSSAARSIAVCELDLVLGRIVSCMKASQGMSLSKVVSVKFNSSLGYLYFADMDAGVVKKCEVNSSNGQLQNCIDVLTAQNGIFDLEFNKHGNQVFLANPYTATLQRCDVDIDGGFINCQTKLSSVDQLSQPMSVSLYGL
ncbi:hypothetical protein [Cysteiniphilum sp. QT6929]|uniref:hypothetical protein n=1 Tax=Cysteiniphilum sp. QT6929 TaxID=2975055 RepID=UPI0024B37479|nr:hypothetical protein [Cysteiniphilum sp. QT6929]WHN65299.1 hypothetical protein NYP54_09655 [Cysteiniphilum sp. QT6929]